MSQTRTLDAGALDAGPTASSTGTDKRPQRRKLLNAVWQPFVQFKLLFWMLGSTAVVAVLLGAFLYFAFSDLISVISGPSETTSYYGEMVEIQLVHVFRYCGALFVLYVLLLATVCVAYTHRLIGPLRPFLRHIEKLTAGDYADRVRLRKSDLDMYRDFADRLNDLTESLDGKRRAGGDRP